MSFVSSASSRSRRDKKAEKAERRKRAAVDRQFKKAAAAAVKEMDVIAAEFQGPRDTLLQRQTVNRRAMEWTRWEEQGFTQDEVKYQLRLDMSLARDKMEKVITEEVQNTAVEQEMDQESLEQLQEEKSQNRWRDWLDGFPASLKRRLPGSLPPLCCCLLPCAQCCCQLPIHQSHQSLLQCCAFSLALYCIRLPCKCSRQCSIQHPCQHTTTVLHC